MKLNLKTLAAAAALAMTSLASHAAITTLANPTLLLAAYDSTGASANSYYRNLGTLNQLNTSSFAFNAPTTGSIFTQQLGGVATGDIGWMIIALDNTAGAQTLYTAAHLAGVTTPSSTNVQNVASFSVGGFGAFGALDLAANGFLNANGVEYTGNLTAGVTGAQTNAADVIAAWTGLTGDVGLGIGDSLNLFKTTATSQSQLYTSSNGTAFGTGSVAGGYFTLLAGGNVTWTNPASVSAVPVPGAALLFGPGLLAVLAAARRRKEA